MSTTPQLKSLHLLRALLREATYLPDAHARAYFRRYIVHRFKAYQPAQNATASSFTSAVDKYRHRSFKRRQLSIIVSRTVQQQGKAQKALNYLRRANQGELLCLRKVLYFAYGRVGRRKYALLSNLLKPDTITDGGRVLDPSDLAGPSPLQKLYRSNKQYLSYLDAPKTANKDVYHLAVSNRYSRLRCVLKSQVQKDISIDREIKRPYFHTPMLNTWLRPMPLRRARNNVRRWYATTMTRLLPPLPTEEWDNLRDMICRAKRVSIPKRRARPAEHKMTDAISEGLALSKLSKADRPSRSLHPHVVTPRFMCRMYQRLLRLCCKLEFDTERKHWVATWGDAVQLHSNTLSSTADASLFEGVDAHGRLPVTKKKQKVDPEQVRELQPRDSKGEYTHFPFYTEYLPERHPLHRELREWKRKRREAGLINEDGTFRRGQ